MHILFNSFYPLRFSPPSLTAGILALWHRLIGLDECDHQVLNDQITPTRLFAFE